MTTEMRVTNQESREIHHRMPPKEDSKELEKKVHETVRAKVSAFETRPRSHSAPILPIMPTRQNKASKPPSKGVKKTNSSSTLSAVRQRVFGGRTPEGSRLHQSLDHTNASASDTEIKKPLGQPPFRIQLQRTDISPNIPTIEEDEGGTSSRARCFYQANQLFKEGQYKLAIQLAQQALIGISDSRLKTSLRKFVALSMQLDAAEDCWVRYDYLGAIGFCDRAERLLEDMEFVDSSNIEIWREKLTELKESCQTANQATVYFAKALEDLNQCNYQASIDAIKQALKLDLPKNLFAQFLDCLALNYVFLGEKDLALHQIDRAWIEIIGLGELEVEASLYATRAYIDLDLVSFKGELGLKEQIASKGERSVQRGRALMPKSRNTKALLCACKARLLLEIQALNKARGDEARGEVENGLKLLDESCDVYVRDALNALQNALPTSN